jgi:hypothetical protein
VFSDPAAIIAAHRDRLIDAEHYSNDHALALAVMP